jgi:hypothetical protein
MGLDSNIGNILDNRFSVASLERVRDIFLKKKERYDIISLSVNGKEG